MPPRFPCAIFSCGSSTSSPTSWVQLHVWLLVVWHNYLAQPLGTVCEIQWRLQLLRLLCRTTKAPSFILTSGLFVPAVSVVLKSSHPDPSAGASFLHALFAKSRQSAAGDRLCKRGFRLSGAFWPGTTSSSYRQLMGQQCGCSGA